MMNVRFTFQILKTTFLFTVQEVLLFFISLFAAVVFFSLPRVLTLRTFRWASFVLVSGEL